MSLKVSNCNYEIRNQNEKSANGNNYFQKGTGKWTGIVALNYGVPLTLIG